MRSLFVLAFLVVGLPSSAQGVYLESGSGASIGYARAPVSTTVFGRRYSASTDVVSAALESVTGRWQLSLGTSYARPRRDVSVYGLDVNGGYLVLHQHRGDGATLALNGGLEGAAVTGEGVTSATSLAATLGPELGISFPLSPSVYVVPSAALGLTVPVGTEGASVATVFGGAVGISLRSEGGLWFALQPGYAVSDGTGTFSFSLKVFMEG